jgi:hypothetical protein
MKRVVFAFVFILGVFVAVFGQEGPIDLVLLLDTSSGMSGSYREVNDYMTGGFLREFLRIGDTFHLIPFSDTPRVDIARRVEGRGDVETIIGRMLLQYPLEPGPDISAALSYAEKYVSTLPSRPKKIILLTGGNTVSPDAAGLQNLVAETKTRLGRQGVVLEYVKVPLTALPSSGRPPQAPVSTGTVAAGNRPAPETPAQTAAPTPGQTGRPPSPAAEQPRPEPAGTPPRNPAAEPSRPPQPSPGQTPGAGTSRPAVPPSTQPGPAQETGAGIQNLPAAPPGPAAAGTSPEQTGTGSGTAGPVSPGLAPPRELPQPPAAGTGEPPIPPAPAGQGSGELEPPRGAGVPPVQPAAPSPAPDRTPAPVRSYNEGDFSLPLVIGLALLGLTALGLIIFLVTRRLQGTPNRAMAQAASARPEPEEPPAESRFTDHSAALASYAATQRPRTGPYAHRYKPQDVEYEGPLMLNLFVEDQSTLIGKRNIHSVKAGYTFTVGGGKSDFLIFLVPIPPHIGELRCDGTRCTFIPRKPQYFPDIGSQQVPDCIGKTIRIISDKNYELHFRMERYEDPLKALNRLLHSVQVPG